MVVIVILVDIDQFNQVLTIGVSRKGNRINYFFSRSQNIFYLPKELFNMCWIKKLSLSGLLGNYLPKNIINMANITTLYINETSVSDISKLTYLKKLKKLCMEYCKNSLNYRTAEGIMITKFVGSYDSRKGLEMVLGRKLFY